MERNNFPQNIWTWQSQPFIALLLHGGGMQHKYHVDMVIDCFWRITDRFREDSGLNRSSVQVVCNSRWQRVWRSFGWYLKKWDTRWPSVWHDKTPPCSRLFPSSKDLNFGAHYRLHWRLHKYFWVRRQIIYIQSTHQSYRLLKLWKFSLLYE